MRSVTESPNDDMTSGLYPVWTTSSTIAHMSSCMLTEMAAFSRTCAWSLVAIRSVEYCA